MKKNWTVGFCIFVAVACSEEGRDDSVLDMSLLTDKDWYYNGWLGEEDEFGRGDLLEVVRFEKGGILKSVDFGGRREYAAGRWENDGHNRIFLKYDREGEKVWHVQHSGKDYIRVVVNEQGMREYTPAPDYLEELTADAFLVNEYASGNRLLTCIGTDVRGNPHVREAVLLTVDGNRTPLRNHEFFWSGEAPINLDRAEEQEVRFYLRIGRDTRLKLRDSLYASNLPPRLPAEMELKVNETGSGSLEVAWKPYPSGEVYYRVEVLTEDLDRVNPYFVSRLQLGGTERLEIKATTAGEINRLDELKRGENYAVRLIALLYEPGVDPWNDGYGYANVQAVSCFTKEFRKE